MSVHSLIGPSSASRRIQCEQSFWAEKEYLEKFGESRSSGEATEGTNAHAVLETWIKEGEEKALIQLHALFHDKAEDHKEYIKVAVDYVEHYRKKGFTFYPEKSFNLSSIHPDCFGTADLPAVSQNKKRILIGDFKYGEGVFVENDYTYQSVEEIDVVGFPYSVQLGKYAIGLLDEFKLWDTVEEIILTVIQPRYNSEDEPIREQKVEVFELKILQAFLKEHYAKVLGAKDPSKLAYKVGSHCQFCNASGYNCPAQQDALNELVNEVMPEKEIMEYESSAHTDQVLEFVAKALQLKPAIDAFYKKVNEVCERLVTDGHGGALGLAWGEGRASNKYPEDIKTPEDLSNALMVSGIIIDPEDVREVSLMAHSNVAKLLDKNGKKVLKDLLVKTPGRRKLVPANSPTALPKDFVLDDFKDIITN